MYPQSGNQWGIVFTPDEKQYCARRQTLNHLKDSQSVKVGAISQNDSCSTPASVYVSYPCQGSRVRGLSAGEKTGVKLSHKRTAPHGARVAGLSAISL
jgi:hypothetical protein